MGNKHVSFRLLVFVYALVFAFSQQAYAAQPYESQSNFKVIAQGNAPSGVACFAMILNYYKDQRVYTNADTGGDVVLNETLGTKIANNSQIWKWINKGASQASLRQLWDAAYKLNDYSTSKAHYFAKMNTDSTLLVDQKNRITQLNYITANYLKYNRPVIIHMTPLNAISNSPAHLVLLGYDGSKVYYANPLDGSIGITSYTNFIQSYFFKSGTLLASRWDGQWMGFYSGQMLPGDHRFSFALQIYDRSFELHVPTNYNGSSPVPLVLDFHGLYQSASVERNVSGFKAKSEEAGFIVAYPEGISSMNSGLQQSWNADTTGGQMLYSWANLTQVDDVAFAVKVVNDVKRQLNIDPTRVYVSGLSQGGSMALLCAHERGDVFAAAAVVSTAMLMNMPYPKPPYGPIAVINFHSYDDELVPYYGSSITGVPPIEKTARQWAIADGCSSTPTEIAKLGYPDTSDPNTPEKLIKYCSPTCGVQVWMYSLHSVTTIGGDDAHDLYETNFHGQTAADKRKYVTDLAWDFLMQFALPH